MEKTRLSKKWIVGGVIYALLLFAILIISNLEQINEWFASVWLVIRPVVLGLIFAYILNPFFNFFEKRIFCRLNPPVLRRGFSLLFSYVAIITIIVSLFWLILPQLIESLISLFQNQEAHAASIASYINGLITTVNDFLVQWTGNEQTITHLNAEQIIDWATAALESMTVNTGGDLQTTIDLVAGIISSLFSVLADGIFAIFISLYYLISKEMRTAQIMRVRNALFSDKTNRNITRFVSSFDHSFGGFVKGKCLEAVIIWVFSYLIFLAFNIPFAILISAFIAIMNIIPTIGIIIGAIPAAVIILLTDPSKLIPFLIIIILVQQIEANILGPKILGDNTGVSALCVMIAIATMGNLWGFVGMILGVPIFASILTIADYYTEKRLQAKGLPAEIESYYPSDALVDPVKDSHLASDKMIQRLEKNILRIRLELLEKRREDLPWRDRALLRIHYLGKKYKLFTEIHDDSIVQYTAEQYHKQSLNAASERFAALDTDTAEDTAPTQN